MAPRKFTDNDDELLAAVREEMHRLIARDSKGIAPSRILWDVRRQKHLPCGSYLITRFGRGWPRIVEMCGATPARDWVAKVDGKPAPQGIADELEAGLASGRITPANWMDRFLAPITVLPTPTRTEQVQGRTLAGQPCVITREYWMVR